MTPGSGSGRGLRKACRALHRWLGLSLGLFLVLLGLTGSLNVYFREIDAALNPALFTPDAPDGTRAPAGPEAALRAASSLDPAPVIALAVPDATWPVWIVSQSHSGGRVVTTMVDPQSGRVLGRRDLTASFANVVYRLHYTLLMKDWWGKEFIGFVGIGLLLVAITGLVAWWPAFGRIVRSLFPRRGTTGQRLWLDLHRSLGAWAAMVLIVIATTGVGIIYPQLVRPIVGVIAKTTEQPVLTVSPAGSERLGADAILARALAARPGDVVTLLNPPGSRSPAWRVLMRPAGADPAMRSLSHLWLDPATGEILADRGWDSVGNGDRYLALQLWLHNGSVAGPLGRALIFVTGLVPLTLFATGLAVWLDRRRRRRAMAREV